MTGSRAIASSSSPAPIVGGVKSTLCSQLKSTPKDIAKQLAVSVQDAIAVYPDGRRMVWLLRSLDPYPRADRASVKKPNDPGRLRRPAKGSASYTSLLRPRCCERAGQPGPWYVGSKTASQAGPGQWMRPRIVKAEAAQDMVHRVPGRDDAPGNDMMGWQMAKEAAYDGGRALPRDDARVITLAHVSRRTTEARAMSRERPGCRSKGYCRHRRRPRSNSLQDPKDPRSTVLPAQAKPGPDCTRPAAATDGKCWLCMKKPVKTGEHLFLSSVHDGGKSKQSHISH